MERSGCSPKTTVLDCSDRVWWGRRRWCAIIGQPVPPPTIATIVLPRTGQTSCSNAAGEMRRGAADGRFFGLSVGQPRVLYLSPARTARAVEAIGVLGDQSLAGTLAAP